MLAPGPIGRRQPTKIGGIVHILLGLIGLFIAGFIFVISPRLGDNRQFSMVFGGVIVLYGLFRIFTGWRTLKQAAKLEANAGLDAKNIPTPTTKAKGQ
ncbi:MAG TPA: hypothetical protein VG537_07880 [Candidatus Kapabacteria bacterium]|jgi:hypothetical protein|nr:hypothetical protein [Candidatus Kapabacteria bacterium]